MAPLVVMVWQKIHQVQYSTKELGLTHKCMALVSFFSIANLFQPVIKNADLFLQYSMFSWKGQTLFMSTGLAKSMVETLGLMGGKFSYRKFKRKEFDTHLLIFS